MADRRRGHIRNNVFKMAAPMVMDDNCRSFVIFWFSFIINGKNSTNLDQKCRINNCNLKRLHLRYVRCKNLVFKLFSLVQSINGNGVNE